MTDDLPADTVERCAKAMRRDAIARTTNNRGIFDPDVQPTETELANAAAVLREAGAAEMATVLGEVRDTLPGLRDWGLLDQIDAALSRYRTGEK